MNREQKAALIDVLAAEIEAADAVIAVDYRGIDVGQAGDLRVRLGQAGASFRVVKNTLTQRAADQAGTEELKQYLVGPTAFAFVRGDAALAAKALATFRRETRLLEFKGGVMGADTLSAEDIDALSRLPALDVLRGQLVGVMASPLTGLARGLASLISGLAVALGQVQEQGLLGGGADSPTADADADAEGEGDADAEGTEPGANADAGEGVTPEAPGDPVSEAAAAEEESTADEGESTASEDDAGS